MTFKTELKGWALISNLLVQRWLQATEVNMTQSVHYIHSIGCMYEPTVSIGTISQSVCEVLSTSVGTTTLYNHPLCQDSKLIPDCWRREG